MLTKKECEKAYEIVKDVFYIEFCPKEAEEENIKRPSWDDFVNSMDLLEKMIKEHFSNPPLKWEELENGKPIWDNKNKEWLFVNNVLSISSEVKGKDYRKFMKVGYKGRKIYFNVEQREIDFEENRFYRKEVQE